MGVERPWQESAPGVVESVLLPRESGICAVSSIGSSSSWKMRRFLDALGMALTALPSVRVRCESRRLECPSLPFFSGFAF